MNDSYEKIGRVSRFLPLFLVSADTSVTSSSLIDLAKVERLSLTRGDERGCSVVVSAFLGETVSWSPSSSEYQPICKSEMFY